LNLFSTSVVPLVMMEQGRNCTCWEEEGVDNTDGEILTLVLIATVKYASKR